MKFLITLLLPIILLVSTGCQRGMVSVDAIEPSLVRIMDRHDAYINSGQTPDGQALTEVEIRTQLRTTELLRNVIEEAGKN